MEHPIVQIPSVYANTHPSGGQPHQPAVAWRFGGVREQAPPKVGQGLAGIGLPDTLDQTAECGNWPSIRRPGGPKRAIFEQGNMVIIGENRWVTRHLAPNAQAMGGVFSTQMGTERTD